jgi:hypothetical protein
MSNQQSSRVERAEEMTALRHAASNTTRDNDIMEWLLLQRDAQAEISAMEFGKHDPDYGVINPAEALKLKFFEAAEELRKLRGVNASLSEALKNRIIVALADAKAPAWEPTHKHYKGTLYRVTGVRMDAEFEELIEKVEYDDADGEKFVLSKDRFNSLIGSGKPRYEFIAK